MFVSFNTLPDSSRIWIYQSPRILTDEEVMAVENFTAEFVESWTAHQAGLKAGAAVFHNRFLVIAVDESYNGASGCSIDKKVNFVKSLGNRLGIDLFDRMTIALLNHQDELVLIPLHDLKKNLQSGNIPAEFVFFNNLVESKGDLERGWKVQAKGSWLENFIE